MRGPPVQPAAWCWSSAGGAPDAIIGSSTFSAEGNRKLNHAIRAFPAANEKRTVRGITDVIGDTYTHWSLGQSDGDPSEAVAPRVEKTIGEAFSRPKKARLLLIPWGDFRKGGKARRRRRADGKGFEKFPIASLPGLRVVQFGDGRFWLVQRLPPGEKGLHERTGRGMRRSKLGERERVVALLVPKVKVKRGLDFFGSWARLEGQRNARYDELLQELADGKL